MTSPKVGILLVNLGTPDAPTASAVKRYLRPFLSDPRVVDLSPWIWQPLLRGIILPKRSPRVAKNYQKIWLEQGSPLLVYSRALQQGLSTQFKGDIPVELGMTYGNPSLVSALDSLMSQGVKRLIVLPLFPQYSCSTAGAVWDQISHYFNARRDVVSLNFIRDYADEQRYLATLSQSIKNSLPDANSVDKILLSFHGIPQRYADEGDDYPLRCKATLTGLKAHLPAAYADKLVMSYQSRFGREAWLQPYTDRYLTELTENGDKRIAVLCPGFAVDCLETLEEIALEAKKDFLASGGETFTYITALNDDQSHIKMLADLITPYLNHVSNDKANS